MKQMIRYLCTLVFFVVAATSAAHSYCANLNTLEANGIACCCAVHTDCNVLQSTCCSVSQSDKAVVPQIDEASTQPPLVPVIATIVADLLPVTVLKDANSRDLSCVVASNKLYLQKRSLLI